MYASWIIWKLSFVGFLQAGLEMNVSNSRITPYLFRSRSNLMVQQSPVNVLRTNCISGESSFSNGKLFTSWNRDSGPSINSSSISIIECLNAIKMLNLIPFFFRTIKQADFAGREVNRLRSLCERIAGIVRAAPILRHSVPYPLPEWLR